MNYTRYRHLAIDGAKPAPSPEQLATIERLLGAQLPSSFREFLKFANGGYVGYMIDAPLENGRSDHLCFCSFYCADEGEFLDETFVGELKAARQYQKMPDGVLPIARDGGGSILYLDLSPEGNGRVVAFVDVLPDWTGRPRQSAFLVLASSFEEYVEKLQIDREVVLDNLEQDAESISDVEATEEFLDIGLPNWREDSELAGAVAEARHRLAENG